MATSPDRFEPQCAPTPATPVKPRRRRSHQRDCILTWLRSTDTHPTAGDVHVALLPAMQGLSLGTVYRNLEVLVAEGDVDEVACAGGVARYDANVEPHHHFHCERCARIVDVELSAPRGLAKRLEGAHGLRARRLSISFFGLCSECDEPEREAACEASAPTATT